MANEIETRWSGDWKKLRTWVKSLFPEDPPLNEISAVVSTVEIYAGARHQMGSIGSARDVDMADMMEDDAERRVIEEVASVLDGLPPDRTSTVIQLKARHIVEGKDEPWPERGAALVQLQRVGAVNQYRAQAAAAAEAAGVMNHGMVPRGGAQPAAVAAGWNNAGVGAAPPSLEKMIGPDVMAAGQGSPMSVMLYLVQHQAAQLDRMVDRNGLLADRIVSVLDGFSRSRETEVRTTRKEADDARRRALEVERDAREAAAKQNATLQIAEHKRTFAEAQQQALEATARTKELERIQAEQAAEDARRQAEEARRVAEDAQRRANLRTIKKPAAAAPSAEPQGIGDQFQERIGAVAGQVIEGVMQQVGQNFLGGGAPPAAAPDPVPAQRQAPAPAPRPGVVIPQPRAAAPAPAPKPAPAAGGFDLSALKDTPPEQIALILQLLPPEQRRAIVGKAVEMNRDFAVNLAEEIAVAVDQRDGVDGDEPPVEEQEVEEGYDEDGGDAT